MLGSFNISCCDFGSAATDQIRAEIALFRKMPQKKSVPFEFEIPLKFKMNRTIS